MKKCLLMFTLLIASLLLAVLTETKPEMALEDDLTVDKSVVENSLLAQEGANMEK